MRRALIGTTLILAVAYAALSLYGVLQLRSARRLVKVVEELPIGAHIPPNLEPEFRNLRCVPTWGCLKGVSNLPILNFFLVPRSLPPRVALSNWWGVLGRVVFDVKGNVIEKSLVIDDGKYHQGVTVGIDVRKDARLFNPCEHPGVAKHLGFLTYREMRTHGLIVEVSPDADRSFLRRAFDLRLDCLNTIRGCESPGDISPDLWSDSVFRPEDLEESTKGCYK
jgi:hypothetical protein